ncbi:MAG: mannose-1-phosphate guanylyltransferase [Gelidibacter sp.]
MNKVKHVVLTGGVGSRLWPLSRISRPKQYLNLFSESSLFELTVKRNAVFSDGLIVVGNQMNRNLSKESLQKLKVEKFIDIVEYSPRNTAPAIAFAALASDASDILLVTPADHIITEGQAYQEAIQTGISLAKEGNIVTFGIQPHKPETGFGYIEANGQNVASFREKPSLDQATEFLSQGNFLWNSGIFCFKAGIFLEELKKHNPETYEKSLVAWQAATDNELEETTSMNIPDISVDYAVMEKSDRIKVVRSDFEWSDMGSFEAMYEYLKAQGHPVDASGNMHIGKNTHTEFIGVQDCILVQTDDANLILSKESSQNVKKIYQELERNNSILIN